MQSFRMWAVAGVLILAGCSDGSIQSPDFTSVTTLENLTVTLDDPQQDTSIPAGTTLRLRALAEFSQTLPPGTRDTRGNPVAQRRSTEDVTGQALWSSAEPAVATVKAGLVRGETARDTPVEIRAAFGDRTAARSVTVTDAVLVAVDHVRPTGTSSRASGDLYAVVAGATVPFEIYGRFSDQAAGSAPRRLDEQTFDVLWNSADPAVANNVAGDGEFRSFQAGTTAISGAVINAASANPDSATATLEVRALGAFCETEFLAPSAVVTSAKSATCQGCAIDKPEAIVDGELDTAAQMSIPAGLLSGSDISATVSDVGLQLAIGREAGFVISRTSSPLLGLGVASSLSIASVLCAADGGNCEIVEKFEGAQEQLRLSLLGMQGDQAQYLLSTGQPITQAANGLRLTFSGGQFSGNAVVKVHAACAVAVP